MPDDHHQIPVNNTVFREYSAHFRARVVQFATAASQETAA
jgi:hypothetical protein